MRPALLLPLLAAFFLRLPSSTTALLRRNGGELVQESAITLNGSPGTLSVFAFDRTVDELAKTLEPSGDATAPSGVFLLPCGSPESPQCLAFAVEAESPGNPEWPWTDLPPEEGFSLDFSATLNDGRTGFAAGVSGLSSAAARAAWNARLSANGWTPVSPASGDTSLSLHAKDNETLALTVLDAPDGTSRISLLRRKPK